MEKTNITIIGAGVCGLAIGAYLSREYRDILVVEQHDAFGRETSSRNSEVIHAGLYYPKDSLKAKLCIQGKDLLYAFCAEHAIPHKKTGKILVACNHEEAAKIHAIQKNALESGVTRLHFLSQKELQHLEPDIRAQEALWSEDTGILDSHQFMKTLYENAKRQGTEFAFNVEVVEISKKNTGYRITVKEPDGDLFSFETSIVINAAGLRADRVAAMAGFDIAACGYKLHWSKGQYFRISHPQKFNITHPVYPPASKTDLGIHITPDLAGGLRLGPDAHYTEDIDYSVDENDKKIFCDSVSRFLPRLTLEDLVPDTAGMRAKLQAPGVDFSDFVIQEESKKGFKDFINLIGIESPGLTSSLAIARLVRTFL
ncbi:MAG TPA: NAD(P)/FAD-dependent oxidoreductase [Candidatus Omnitrophota bacterium]|nr:NAD(P)/FAD-dependent oxidoreductase [Candidatus Omnitrophota bacterium]HQL41521.1 NAD(P)/FAD-dependent oxidoreductase [Candidatus Omnitrophota bacterium]